MSFPTNSVRQPHESAAVRFRADAIWIGCFALYFAALLIGRVAFGGASLNWDDAELPVAAGLYRPGYGPQLPIYHWFQNGLFELFGISVFSISLGRDLIRLLSAVVVYCLARQVARPATAAAVTLGLELNIHFAWYAQRAFSHNNSAILFGLLAVFVFWLALERPHSWTRWLLFGAVSGLGLLSKYNFLFVPFTLVIAAFTDRNLRPTLPWLRIVAAFALAAAMVALPYQWIADHLRLATGASGSLDLADGNPVAARLSGLFELVQALLSNAAIGAVLALLLVRFAPKIALAESDEEVEAARCQRLGGFLLRYLICFSAILTIGLLFAGIGNVRDRWLLPVFSIVGPTAVLLIWHRISHAGKAILLAVCGLIALAVLIGHPLESRFWKDRGNAPFGQVVAAMDKIGAGPGTYVIAPFQWNAGNLKHRRPDWIVDDYRLMHFGDGPSDRFLLVLDNDTNDVRRWSERLGPEYEACAGRPALRIDTAKTEPDRRRLEFYIRWICPGGSTESDK